jgi:hypothetical protein
MLATRIPKTVIPCRPREPHPLDSRHSSSGRSLYVRLKPDGMPESWVTPICHPGSELEDQSYRVSRLRAIDIVRIAGGKLEEH